jgi:hypothetical protein
MLEVLVFIGLVVLVKEVLEQVIRFWAWCWEQGQRQADLWLGRMTFTVDDVKMFRRGDLMNLRGEPVRVVRVWLRDRQITVERREPR